MPKKIIRIFAAILITAVSFFGQAKKFAVIGGYGIDDATGNEAAVARLVKSWKPDFIITLGGNNYPDGAVSTIDRNIGRHYHEYIFNYQGEYGAGSPYLRFFPSLGEQDYRTDSASPYLNYFTLPGNERYYDFVQGDAHFFILDSNPETPGGVTENGVQATWLKNNLAAATETWKIVCFYHSPYSSGGSGSSPFMRWNFKEWGASVVLTGQDNDYERLRADNFPFIVNGLGGRSGDDFGGILATSRFRYNENFGALKVEVYPSVLQIQFFNIYDSLIDNLTLQALAAPANLSAAIRSNEEIQISWTDQSSAEKGFLIERSFDGVIYQKFETVAANRTRLIVPQMPERKRVFYRVKAVRDQEESLPSNTVISR